MRFGFGEFEADALRLTLTRAGESVPIEPKPLRLLLYLLARHPAIVSKEELLEALWPTEQVTDQSLTRAVHSARRALGRQGVIRNVRGRGYGIAGAVERISATRSDRTDDARDPFVGREAELAALRAALGDANAGRGRVALLAGEPGIGKTRTAGELARWALMAGVEVVWGRAAEEGGAPPLWPWIQVLRALARSRDAATLRAALGRGAEALADLVPEIRDRLVHVGQTPELAPEQERFRLFDAASQLLARVGSDRTLLLIFDDLHAADPTTLDLLVFAARELADARVLLLGTYRSLGPAPAEWLERALARLARLPGSSPPIVLQGLTCEEVARLVATVPGSMQGHAARIHARSDGNPFFVRELLRLADPGPGATTPGVRAVVRSRLRALADPVRAMLETAAVIGRQVPLELLMAALGAELEAVWSWIEAAGRAGFVAREGESSTTFCFSHAVLQETVYGAIALPRRRRLHRRVGDALEALQAGLLEPHLTSLARHFERAADAERSAHYAGLAGDQARSRFAFEEAASAYVRALALGGPRAAPDRRREMLLSLGEVQRLAGYSEKAVEAFREAADLARTDGDVSCLARAACGMADCAEPIFPRPESLTLVEEALSLLGSDVSSLRVELLGRRAKLLLTYLSSRQDELALEIGDLVVEEAQQLGDAEARAGALAHRLAIHQARPLERSAEERMEMAAEAFEASQLVGRDDLALQAHRQMIAIALERGVAARLDAEIHAFASHSDRVRIRSQRHFAAAYLAMRALQQGRYADAELWIDGAEALADPADPLERFHTPLTQRTLLPPQPARDRALEQSLRAMAEQLPQMPQWWLALGVFCAERDRLAEAAEIVDRVVPSGFLEKLPRTVGWLVAASALVRICAALERRGEAASVLELLAPHAEVRVVAGFGIACLGPVRYYMGRLAGLLERYDEAEASLRAALAQDLRLEARPWQARDRFALARVLWARGDSAAARLEVHAARDVAMSIGMSDYVAREEGVSPL